MAFVNRPFAFNSGSTAPTGTVQFGSTVAGEPTDGYPSTGLTWWGGANEAVGKWIISLANSNIQRFSPTGAPGVTGNIWFKGKSGDSDSTFLSFAQEIAGQQFSSIPSSISWLNSNGYWNSFSNANMQGLIVWLDTNYGQAINGSTWYDISGNGYNATLYNGAALNGPKDAVSFNDGSYQYATIPELGNLTNWTLEVWARINTTNFGAGKTASLISNIVGGSSSNFGIFLNSNTSDKLKPGFKKSSGTFFSGTEYDSKESVQQYVATWDNGNSKLTTYQNGEELGFYNPGTNGFTSGGLGNVIAGNPYSIGNNTTSEYLKCDIILIRIYDGTLNGTTIKRNYNDLRLKYGL